MMRKQQFTGCLGLFVGILLTGLFLPNVRWRCRAQEVDVAKLQLSIPNGWKQLPDWAASDLPFDADQYYGIPDDQNREQFYLKAILCNQFSRDTMRVVPGWETLIRREDFLKQLTQAETLHTEFGEFYFRFLETPHSKRDSVMMAIAETLLVPFRTGFNYLKLAQRKPKCFFHVEIDTAALSSLAASRDIARKLSVECNLDLCAPRAIECLQLAFQLQIDIRPLGEMITQLVASGMEGICVDEAVLPMLEHPQMNSIQLERLISVLKNYRAQSRESDCVVESSRFEYLMFKRLFHELATGAYLPRESAREIFGDENLPRSVLVQRELNQLCFYEFNSAVVGRFLKEMAAENDAIGQAAEKVRESSGEGSLMDSMVVAPMLFKAIENMTENDYRNEMKVLASRCRQLESACQMPFPDSTKELLNLSQHWTTDDAWKSTKILKWFSPHKKLVSVRTRRHLRTNALLCLAAVRLWQLKHDGVNPTDLETALAEASIMEPMIDPHSGEPLKLLVGDRVLIYSIGPDGVDDQARQTVEYWVTTPDKKGDVIFELKLAE